MFGAYDFNNRSTSPFPQVMLIVDKRRTAAVI